MSAQQLSPRSTRRIAHSTGLDVVRAWSHGGYVMGFVTADHRHGWWDKKTGDWGWAGADDLVHYSSCRELFGDCSARIISVRPHRMKTATFDGLV